MRKKWLGIFSSFLLIISLIAGCSCNKDHVNSEYDEFKRVIDSVIQQYEEGDSTEPLSYYNYSKSKSYVNLLSLSNDNRSNIKNMVNADFSKEQVSIDYYYQDAFEQSFYVPLIAGDVYAYTLKNDKFYGQNMMIETNTQYIMVESQGTYKYVYCFTPAGSIYNEDYYNVLILNYTSAQDYEFTILGFNNDYSNISYIYGNNSKEIIVISRVVGGDGTSNHVVATLGGAAYESTNSEVLNNAYSFVSSEITSQDKEKIKNVSNGNVTTITSSAYQTALDKYFEDTGKIMTNTIGYADEKGEVLALIGCDSSGVVTIPSNIKYLNKELSIGCSSSDITLKLHSGIIGIKENDIGVIKDVNVKDFEIRTDGNVPLTSIIVESGSTLFKSGNGHLQTIDGTYLYYLNLALPGGVIEANDVLSNPEFIENIRGLSNLKNSIHTVNYTLGSEDDMFEELIKLFPNLRTINLDGEPSPYALEVMTNSGDLTVNLDVTGRISINYVFTSEPVRNKINLLNKEGKISYSSNVNTISINAPWTEKYYDTFNFSKLLISGVSKSNITFITDEYSAEMGDVEIREVDGGLKVKIDAEYTSSSIIPEDYYGLTFTETEIITGNNELYVKLPSTVTSLYVTGAPYNNYGLNATIEYDGTYEEFESIIKNSQGAPFRINLICEDYEGEYSFNVIKVTFNEGTRSETRYIGVTCSESGCFWMAREVLFPEVNDLEKYEYYYKDQYDNHYELSHISYYYLEVNLGINDEIKDLVLTMVEEPKLLSFIIQVNGQTIYDKQQYYGANISVGEVEENGERKLVFTINDGTQEESVTYTIDENASWTTEGGYSSDGYTLYVMVS